MSLDRTNRRWWILGALAVVAAGSVVEAQPVRKSEMQADTIDLQFDGGNNVTGIVNAAGVARIEAIQVWVYEAGGKRAGRMLPVIIGQPHIVGRTTRVGFAVVTGKRSLKPGDRVVARGSVRDARGRAGQINAQAVVPAPRPTLVLEPTRTWVEQRLAGHTASGTLRLVGGKLVATAAVSAPACCKHVRVANVQVRPVADLQQVLTLFHRGTTTVVTKPLFRDAIVPADGGYDTIDFDVSVGGLQAGDKLQLWVAGADDGHNHVWDEISEYEVVLVP